MSTSTEVWTILGVWTDCLRRDYFISSEVLSQ